MMEDGYSVEGYMCLTDFECELGSALGGNRIFPDLEDLIENKPCVEECGIAKVKVTGIEVIQESDYSLVESG